MHQGYFPLLAVWALNISRSRMVLFQVGFPDNELAIIQLFEQFPFANITCWESIPPSWVTFRLPYPLHLSVALFHSRADSLYLSVAISPSPLRVAESIPRALIFSITWYLMSTLMWPPILLDWRSFLFFFSYVLVFLSFFLSFFLFLSSFLSSTLIFF